MTNDLIDGMSDKEKTMVCMLAGCEMELVGDWRDGKLTYRAKNPVGFIEINGKIQVYERKS